MFGRAAARALVTAALVGGLAGVSPAVAAQGHDDHAAMAEHHEAMHGDPAGDQHAGHEGHGAPGDSSPRATTEEQAHVGHQDAEGAEGHAGHPDAAGTDAQGDPEPSEHTDHGGGETTVSGTTRATVLGGFGVVNAAAVAGAFLLRRRDSLDRDRPRNGRGNRR